jgi:hypothetical protein
MAYLRDLIEPDDSKARNRLQQRARGYLIINDQLYKSGVCAPLLKCVHPTEGSEILRQIHSGACGGHIAPWALAAKVFRQGFFWPTALRDAQDLYKTCEACQKFAAHRKASSQPLQLIAPTWPLQRWGVDIVGPLPTAQGNYKFTMVAVEYFTRWVEAKPVANITSASVKRFVWQNIVCRFWVPRELTVDNGRQFDSEEFKEFCGSLGIQINFASVYHP